MNGTTAPDGLTGTYPGPVLGSSSLLSPKSQITGEAESTSTEMIGPDQKNGAGDGNRTHGPGIMRPSLYH